VRIFFSVGEPSGDLHASNLIRHFKSQDPSIECVGYGGPKMRAAGCELHYELTQLAVMFVLEALRNISTFLRLANKAETYFKTHHVDAVVLIDYPGFNWWIAKRARKQGIPVFFYGVPQMWAWGPWRIKKIRKWVDHVLCKLPFEVDWFRQRNCQATYVGHPFFDQLATQTYDRLFLADCKRPNQFLLTLLPGSRNHEVEQNLPMLLSAARIVQREVPNVKVAVACYNQRHYEIAAEQIGENPSQIELHVDRTPELMKSADACLACSGSVSLELLYHRKPTVIVYKTSAWLMLIQAFVLRIKFITLVNLLGTNDIRRTSWRVYDPDAAPAVAAVMPEYLTNEDRSAGIARHVVTWFQNPETAAAKVDELDRLARTYALPGATSRAAEYILNSLNTDLSYRRLHPNEVPAYDTLALDAAAESGFGEQTWEEKAA
jgi:lipid-A-disaccharide synthase